jgi:hypothetical protein
MPACSLFLIRICTGIIGPDWGEFPGLTVVSLPEDRPDRVTAAASQASPDEGTLASQPAFHQRRAPYISYRNSA